MSMASSSKIDDKFSLNKEKNKTKKAKRQYVKGDILGQGAFG